MESTEDLSKRVVRSKHWRWLPGMLAQTPEGTRVGRVVERLRTGGVRMAGGGNVGWRCVPDLDDPATIGCLLALVREAWGDDRISSVANTIYDTRMILIPETALPYGERVIGCAATEAEALVAALEAAP